MKNIYLLGILLLMTSSSFAQFKTLKIRKIDYPEVEIVQIDFREFSTLVHMRFVNKSLVGNVIYINDNYHIIDNLTKKKYNLLNSFNLPLKNNNKQAVLEEMNQIINFTLEFEKLPDSAYDIDIIEDRKTKAFNFWGVEINKQIIEKDYIDVTSFTKSTPVKEMSFYYKDGDVVEYYQENGLKIAVLLSYDYNYGTYYQPNILIQNLTGKDINFDPSEITSTIHNKTGTESKVLTYAEYMKKIRNRQNWNSFAVAFSESMAASNAGHSTSTTQSSINGYSKSFGSAYGYYGNTYGSVYGSSYSYGSAYSNSHTQNYDGAAAYAAQQNANRNIVNYQNQQNLIKKTLSDGYMKLNTIMTENEYIGYVNVAYKKTDRISINVPINGKTYVFIFNFLE